MVRGLVSQLEQFEIWMQAQMFPWKRKDKDGKEELVQVQAGLRKAPWGYEYIFPEECLDEVLTMLKIDPNGQDRWSLGKFKGAVIRKMLGKGDNGDPILPIPKYTPVLTLRYIELRGVAIYPIGIKKDARTYVDGWGYEQEML